MNLKEMAELAETLAKILGVFAAAGGAIVGIITMVKYSKKWAVSTKKYVQSWLSMPATVQSQCNRVENIEMLVKRELTANGGSSIRDAITRIDKRQILDEQRNRAILEHLSVPFWETDADGKVIYVSRELCLLTSRLVHDLLGHGWINAIHPRDREKVTMEWDLCLKQKREFVMHFSFISGDGVEIPVKAEAILLKDKFGTVLGFTGKVWRIIP